MNQPLISVLMTAYNREKFIAEAIDSVLSSTYTNFELIIVDDCSIDKTLAIAKSFEALDKRIKVYLNEKNLGDYPNRNRAASYAKGKYIKYLDSDDTIYPTGLFYCVEQMEKYPEAFFGISMIDNDHSVPSILMSSEEVIRKHFFKSGHLLAGASGSIIERTFFEKVGGFDPCFRMASDSFFNIKVAALTPVVLLKDRFFFYRIHEGQEQNNPNGYFIYGFLAIKEVLKTLTLPLSKDEITILKRRYNRNHAVGLIRHLIYKNKIRETYFVMKETKFGISDIIKGLLLPRNINKAPKYL